jgi:hypothetical protein
LAGRSADPEADPLSVSVRLSSALSPDAPPELRAALREQVDLWLERDNPDSFHRRRPLNWLVEFPEVFLSETGRGFDAVLGNPPFLHGQRISGTLGSSYREYLVNVIAGGVRGSADLCAYFFRRLQALCSEGGAVGLVATNTIAQGAAREVALNPLVANGFTVYRAVRNEAWPGDAAVDVSKVWLWRGPWDGPVVLDGDAVEAINAFLTDEPEVGSRPQKLGASSGIAFQGSIAVGKGFLVTPQEAARLSNLDRTNSEVLFPFLGGSDVASRPDQSPSRWAIYFFDWPQDRAANFTAPYQVLVDRVKPEREKNKVKRRRERWWQFGSTAKALYHAIGRGEAFEEHPEDWTPNGSPLERVIVVPTKAAKYAVFSMVPSEYVYAHSLAVIASDDFGIFSVLNSALHRDWAWRYCATRRRDLQYSITDAFETFPFPADPTPLRSVGQRYHRCRQELMGDRDEGMTSLYNAFHNPDNADDCLTQFRELQVELDRSVLESYGWSKIEPEHDFADTPLGVRYGISEDARREVASRLLALNHARHAAEKA